MLSDNLKKSLLINLFIFFLVVLFDQVTKRLLYTDLSIGHSKDFLPGIVQFTIATNTGGAFSILRDYPIFFIIVAIINLFVFSYFAFCPTVKYGSSIKMGCSFILGGILGNLIDRLSFGAVIDFIDLQFIDFAIFNVADIAINIGVVLISIGWILEEKRSSSGTRNYTNC